MLNESFAGPQKFKSTPPTPISDPIFKQQAMFAGLSDHDNLDPISERNDSNN